MWNVLLIVVLIAALILGVMIFMELRRRGRTRRGRGTLGIGGVSVSP
jgi:hypothetical protein